MIASARCSYTVRRLGSGGGVVSEPRGERLARLELVATVLLALATVATAWSSYQASRWNAEQAKAAAGANALRISSAKFDALANTETQVDVGTFTAWVDAYSHRDTKLAGFYLERARPEISTCAGSLDRDTAAAERACPPYAVRDAAIPPRRQRRGARCR